MNSKGVYKTTKKDGSTYYRVSITYKNKHISLGSFDEEIKAVLVYEEAWNILKDQTISINSYNSSYHIPFEKMVCLINFRDNGMYISTPIYIRAKIFYYYLSVEQMLIFDVDDLFYYSSHKIMKRGNHLFVADYGMQVNIASRYGIKNHAVLGKDYDFINGNKNDYRYSNIVIYNKYQGILPINKNGKMLYKSKIHIKGDFVIGTFDTIEKAAIAYNKAADTLKKNGCPKEYVQNFIDSISPSEYAQIYTSIKLPSKITSLKF